MTYILIAIIILLLALAGWLSAIETAFTASVPAKLHKMLKNSNNASINLVIRLLKSKEQVISTVLICYTIISIAMTTLATTLFIIKYGEELGAFISLIVMTGVIIIFAEILPKALAISNPENTALHTAKSVQVMIKILHPLIISSNYIIRIFYTLFRVNKRLEISLEEEVKGIVDYHHSEGSKFKTDRRMIYGLLEIDSITVSDIMIHRSVMKTIDINLKSEDIVSKLLDMPFSRIPLWKNNKDNIVGILYLKEFLKVLKNNNFQTDNLKLEDFMHEPWFIPENVSLNQQLNAFREKRYHIALIVNEYGDLKGMVTLEDILEEIVGQIEDEYDQIAENIIKKRTNQFIIEGSTTIRDINRELDLKLPEEQAATLTGLLINLIARIPEQGERFELLGMHWTVRKKVGNKIKTLILSIPNKNK